jgi:hypothetical protein
MRSRLIGTVVTAGMLFAAVAAFMPSAASADVTHDLRTQADSWCWSVNVKRGVGMYCYWRSAVTSRWLDLYWQEYSMTGQPYKNGPTRVFRVQWCRTC